MMGGGPIGGYAQEGKWGLEARFNRIDLVRRIRRIASYRDRIKVSKLDARQLLNKLPGSEPRTLVYLDPPYFQKGQRLYLNALEASDHAELADLLLSNPRFHWVLTYDNVPQIRKLYKSLKPRPFELSYSAYERRVGRELLVLDPRLNIPDDLKTHNRAGRLRFFAA
jgi:DNA adenine methylase